MKKNVSESTRKAVETETKALMDLSFHPNIINVIDIGEDLYYKPVKNGISA